MDDVAYMKEALQEARNALLEDEVPVGAIVVCGDAIVGRGYNCRARDNSPFGHAEMQALADAAARLGCWRFDGCVLYVTLEPCPMCAGAIVQCRLARVVYGARDPKAGAGGSLYDILRDPRMPHRSKVTRGILKGDCAEILRTFFAGRRARRKKEPHGLTPPRP